MKSFLIFLTIILSLFKGYSQDWVERHKFAKSYFGISNFFTPNLPDGNFKNTNRPLQSFERSGFVTPAINIGATHFWGHADFYVSISTVDIKLKKNDTKYNYELGTFTGLRVYPLASKINTVRPYIGYKFSPFTYSQKNTSDQDFRYTKVKSVFDLGLGIQLPNLYVTLEYGRVLKTEFNTFLTRSEMSSDRFPVNLLQIGVNYTIETTGFSDTEVSRNSNKLFSKSNKWGFFFGAGPSAVFPIKSSDYITDLYPFLDDKSMPIIFPDIVLGYHYTKLDLITSLSFRPINQKRKAYGFEQNIMRRSVNLECYKFLGDYHGFAPFIGVGTSCEYLTLKETDNGVAITEFSETIFSPNIVFGWDIRPSEKGDWWILRTNLRYYPVLNLEHRDKTLSLNHLEFNFIQFVVYPQRIKKMKNAS